jgi:ATP-dependent protease ClpP protease subunit
LKTKFWRFTNATDPTGNSDPELVLEGDITDQDYWWDDNSVSPQQFRQDLAALGNPNNINVRINSGGGDVFAAHAIHNMLKAHPAKKTVLIDGLCASAATIVAMAGDTVKMPVNAIFMVHKPAAMLWGSYNTDDMEKMSKTLDTVQDSIIASYQEKTGRSVKDLNALMDAETWMTAAQAKAEGFVDDVIYTDPNGVNEAKPLNQGRYIIVNSVAHDMSRYNQSAIHAAFHTLIINGVVPPNVSTEKADEDVEWSAPALKDFTDQSWNDLTDQEKRHIAGYYAWAKENPADHFGDLKMPHHQASDGKVVWRGVANAAARLNQADIPAEDKAKVQFHLGEHYKAFGKTAPWDEDGKETNNLKNLTRFQNGFIPAHVSTETAPEDTEWAAPTLSDFTDKNWSDLNDSEKKNIAGHFSWTPRQPADSYSDLKLPHHRPSDGKMVLNGVRDAASKIDKEIPDNDVDKVKEHLSDCFNAFGKTAPWDTGADPDGDGDGGTDPDFNPNGDDPIENKAKIKNKGGKKVEIKTVDDLAKAYPDLVDLIIAQAMTAEQIRIKEIDDIAHNLDKPLVEAAKYGEKPMSAKDLAYEAVKADKSLGKNYLDARSKELANGNTKNVDGYTDTQPETSAITDKIAAYANKRLEKNGGKK